jgi:hypothetical protein
MNDMRETLSPRQMPAPIRWLFVANWILLGVAWVLSMFGYLRLPQEVASWLSLWKGRQLRVERSLAFFVYPVSQVFFFFAFLTLAKIFFVKGPEPGKKSQPLDTEKTGRMLDLKKEVIYLALIFFNLIFIHLQTSLILLSHQMGTGINKYYFSMLIMVIFILIPYYHIRRKMILTERS